MLTDIITKEPKALKNAIIKKIKEEKIRTWEIRYSADDATLITHSSDQYRDVVLIEFTEYESADILEAEPKHWSHESKPSEAVKAIVLGNLTAMLITHFPKEFTALRTVS
jgi:hypothetical protein